MKDTSKQLKTNFSVFIIRNFIKRDNVQNTSRVYCSRPILSSESLNIELGLLFGIIRLYLLVYPQHLLKVLNRSRTKINLNYGFSPYRAVNTLRLSYTNQSVNVVQ
jgi:hypothetical protein